MSTHCFFDARRPLRVSRCILPLLAMAMVILCAPLAAQSPLRGSGSPVHYRFTFPEPQHHWMQVEATFTDLDASPLELRMSRSSPGRYSMHDFAKNVYDVEASGPDGRALAISRPDPYGWTLQKHPSAVTVRYKVFGDRVDGTYLAVDRTHAHLNMPASIMFARGLDARPATLTFVAPRVYSDFAIRMSTVRYQFFHSFPGRVVRIPDDVSVPPG